MKKVTAETILSLEPGEEHSDIPPRPEILRLFAARCAERVLLREREEGREPAMASWEAVRVAERFANGEATEEELRVAWSAARAAARKTEP